jgi:uncharacterized membrane protein
MKIWKIKIPKSIIILTIFAIVLNIFRVIIWSKFSFLFILWNIFLAFIPFVISSLLLSFFKENKLNKIFFVTGTILWVLFIPNAPYIITDFIHLGETRSVPVLFDIFLLFSSASVGLILFFYSLSHIEQIIKVKYKKNITYTIIGIILIIISFGLYLGRFLRFNSWDIFINHISLVKNIWKIISQVAGHVEVYLYIALFFIFLLLSYSAWKYSNKND